MLFKDRVDTFVPATIPAFANKLFLDVAYTSQPQLRLDIYLPAGKGPFPIILDIYGGGLLRGKKSSFKLNSSLRFLANGFAVISVDYCLNTQFKSQFPNQVSDIRSALEYLSINSAKYQLDMSHVTLIGESSGAQLAVLAAATFSAQYTLGRPSKATINHKFPKVNRVIAMYGPYQVDHFQTQFEALGIKPQFSETGTAQSFEGIMIHDHAPRCVPNLVTQSNPATYFTKNMPPLMLIAGKKDPVVPYLQSVQLAATYRTIVGNHIKTQWLPYGVHGPKDYNNDAIHIQKLTFINQN
ncbi:MULTISPECIES: alpha/beta hydrolase [Leuconostoc gelidum group]|uniref:Alpha/beta hydrolase n=1 Tax=Leuconostoc gelidum subsp. gelidum TaxID=1607839 RepID=A0AB35FZE7_LEUGE|nr:MULTISPECIES: alpha/beta hydrolase [Leuconostoc gelidum group]MBZ5969374.1 alpha/beta hydrolase [Leuconostoc gasicomitatum]MBZ5974472.1 alpha/beta hydrolase [Leuconostoc gelidum subsp. gelidum]MBZ5997906.1 alpha/beta hydrolase [Leuconostoc gasicomitatum]MBZ6015877.1 alpha/beta hydrolase [Leuconostoc gelidum subsp. gelidum]